MRDEEKRSYFTPHPSSLIPFYGRNYPSVRVVQQTTMTRRPPSEVLPVPLSVCRLAIVTFILAGLTFADESPPKDERRAAPQGPELVDLGASNPKLKGYKAPK